VHLPPHPFWFWLVLGAPWLFWLALWIAANTLEKSLKPLTRWLWAGYIVFLVPYLFFDLEMPGQHKVLRMVSGVAAWGCYGMAFWIKRRYMFETLRGPGARWYLPWKGAEFSVPSNTRILVRDIDSVAPWYEEKLGLRKPVGNPRGEAGVATLSFKEDGNSIILTTHGDFRTEGTPILFTRKVGKMRDVMAARGVKVGPIERDRQGTAYFQIRDPEGNEIEVVQES
jgi:predicted enzyme related to lactoylglutathione lyase